MKVLLAAVAMVMLDSHAFAQKPFPAGTYSITGVVSAVAGAGCSGMVGSPISGYLVYPGPGNPGTALEFPTASNPSHALIFDTFPNVPANGLNGWTNAAPAMVMNSDFVNGALNGAAVADNVSFVVKSIYTAVVQGSVTFSGTGPNGPCTETENVTLVRTGAVH